MKRILIGVCLVLSAIAPKAEACVQCYSPEYCGPALGFGFNHCYLTCTGGPEGVCWCIQGGGMCMGAALQRSNRLASDAPRLKSVALQRDEMSTPDDALNVASAVSPVSKTLSRMNNAVSTPADAALPPAPPGHNWPEGCTRRNTASGGYVISCGPQIGVTAANRFIYTAAPAVLDQLAEVNGDLAYILHRHASLTEESSFELSGGEIVSYTPRAAAVIRETLQGRPPAGLSKQDFSTSRYSYIRLGDGSDGFLKFVFSPSQPDASPAIIVQFRPVDGKINTYRLESWRLR